MRRLPKTTFSLVNVLRHYKCITQAPILLLGHVSLAFRHFPFPSLPLNLLTAYEMYLTTVPVHALLIEPADLLSYVLPSHFRQ
jgi:hypothetical protein